MIKHIALECEDKEKAKIFFTDILGLPLTREFEISSQLSKSIFEIDEACQIISFDDGNTFFEIFITKRSHSKNYDHVCIEVDEMKEFISRCKNKGINPIIVSKGEKSLIFIEDFSNNLYEIKERKH
jgi:catechol 2,3-dioxygenase-like lactoylglutathione lyase family enzyme